MTLVATLNSWFGAAALLISIGNWVWSWVNRPARDMARRITEGDKANSDKLTEVAAEIEEAVGKVDQKIDGLISVQEQRFDRHREDLKVHDRRIQRLEDELPHLPTKDDLNVLGHKLTALETETAGIARTLTRIDDFLRKQP